jgi:hypothetical protein
MFVRAKFYNNDSSAALNQTIGLVLDSYLTKSVNTKECTHASDGIAFNKQCGKKAHITIEFMYV